MQSLGSGIREWTEPYIGRQESSNTGCTRFSLNIKHGVVEFSASFRSFILGIFSIYFKYIGIGGVRTIETRPDLLKQDEVCGDAFVGSVR